jgi:hypothetical protein
VRQRTGFLVLLFLVCLFIVSPGITLPVFAAEKEAQVQLTKYLSFAVKAKRLFNSHTSYEFGNPFPPYQAPLSRLEFPLDSWWGGAEIRASFPRFSIGAEALGNIPEDAGRRMRDSDWDDDENPSLRTIYSESKCRMEPSYMVRADIDLEISDFLGLPQWFSLRPVAGFRWQDFHVVTHDGVQYDLSEPSALVLLPGDGIDFSQTYSHYFLGLRSNIDAGQLVHVTGLNLLLQADWAYVEGHNEDHHLLRAGNRFTYEDTAGQAWHVSAALKKTLYKKLLLGVEADYLWINTTGSHRLVNDVLGVDVSFSNGVKVWSEQASVSVFLEYRF